MVFVELVRKWKKQLLKKTTMKEKESYGKDLMKQQPIVKIGNSMEKNKFYFQHKLQSATFQYSYARNNYFPMNTWNILPWMKEKYELIDKNLWLVLMVRFLPEAENQ